MKIYEKETGNGFTVELIDLQDAGAPNDACMVRVLKDGEIIDERFLEIMGNGVPWLVA